PGSSVPLYLVHCPAVYDRPSIYTSGVDEHLRFLVLQRAVLDGCQRMQFAPDVMHCNDWHTALMPMMLKNVYASVELFAAKRAVLDGCQRMQFAPDVMHCNDWHTALMPMMLKSVYAWDELFAATRSVMSIHNIGYQGVFDASTAYEIGGDVHHLLSPETLAGGG